MSNLSIDKLTVSEKKHDLCNFFSQKVVLYHLENIISFRIRNNPSLQQQRNGVKGLYYKVKKIKGLENLSLWQRLNSFIWLHGRNSKLVLFSIAI